MPSANPEITAEVTSAKSSRPPSRKSSVDLGSGGAQEAPPQPERRKLQFLPRSIPRLVHSRRASCRRRKSS
ncbi:hypothetical protein FKP32DRAFT_1593535 [Trametes sanguinea]|nr:hypothetical protein FKP32DRAFT_1593535 [Trametes sanguinea]